MDNWRNTSWTFGGSDQSRGTDDGRKMNCQGWRRREGSKGTRREDTGRAARRSQSAITLLGSQTSDFPGLEAFTVVCCEVPRNPDAWVGFGRCNTTWCQGQRNPDFPYLHKSWNICSVRQMAKGPASQSLHKSCNTREHPRLPRLSSQCCPLLVNTQECRSLPNRNTWELLLTNPQFLGRAKGPQPPDYEGEHSLSLHRIFQHHGQW